MKLTENEKDLILALREKGITEAPEVKKWEPSEAGWEVDVYGDVCLQMTKSSEITKSASCRKTKQQAEQLAELRPKQSRLHALVCEIEKEPKGWIDGKYNCFITKDKEWSYGVNYLLMSPVEIYMREDTAKKIVKMLKSGEFEL